MRVAAGNARKAGAATSAPYRTPYSMRTLACFLLFLFAFLPTRAADTDLWKLHLAYHNATETAAVGTKIYALFDGNLLAYDTSENSVTTIDKLSGLSDKGISHIGWSTTQKCLVVLYSDNNIDLVYEDGTVSNFPEVYNFADYDVSVLTMTVNEDWLTLSTREGLIQIDLGSLTVKGNYRFGSAVSASLASGNYVFMETGGRVYMGDIRDNLYDLSAWHPQGNAALVGIVPFGKGFYFLVSSAQPSFTAGAGVVYMELDATDTPVFTRASTVVCARGSAQGSVAVFNGSGYTVAMSSEKPAEEMFRVATAGTVKDVACVSGTYWFAKADEGLCGYRLIADGETKSWSEQTACVGGFGPQSDVCDKLQYIDGRLLVAGGEGSKPVAMWYEDDTWHSFPTTGFQLNNGAAFQGVTGILQDPADASHHYLTTWTGMMEYKDFQFVKHYNHSNSALQIINDASVRALSDNYNYVRTYGLVMDAQRNLFVTNGWVDTVLTVMKPDGSWRRLYVEGMKMATYPERLLIDSKGRLWLTVQTQTSYPAGLGCLDYKGTVDTPGDDESLFRKAAINEDGTSCSLEGVQDYCFDRNGQLWIGCTSGVYAVTEPDKWFSSDFTIYQPKIPRNDGTNYADYLLAETTVDAVAVDGGNCKWLGTTGSGVYQVNADGSQVLQHFTAADSPLLSDNISALTFDEATGELFIGTDRGICSYQTGVSEPEEELVKSNIKISPNPVRPEYSGRVVISGLTESAEVKIVSAGGQLVYRGNSTGGSLVWDVRTPAGDRVTSGVYYIYVSKADGSKSVAGKIAVI